MCGIKAEVISRAETKLHGCNVVFKNKLNVFAEFTFANLTLFPSTHKKYIVQHL
jgi:hypothetical protein